MKNENAKHKKMLIVDDNQSDVVGLMLIAMREGFEVALAIDGDDACAKARNEYFDLIFLDWNMPFMPGWKFLSDLESGRIEVETHSGMPVNIVIYSGQSLDINSFSWALEFQILDVWNKTLSPIEMKSRIQKLSHMIQE